MNDKTYNCPSCGAPITDNKCPYCGCVIHDFATIDMGHSSWIRIKLNGKIVVTRAYVQNARFSIREECDFGNRYIDGKILAFKPKPVAEIEMTLVTDGEIKIVSQDHPYEEGVGYLT